MGFPYYSNLTPSSVTASQEKGAQGGSGLRLALRAPSMGLRALGMRPHIQVVSEPKEI